MTPERERELLERLAMAVVNYDEQGVREAALEGLREGIDPNKAVFNGLVEGMQEVGRLYEKQEYFVPELLMCADALNEGLAIFKPLIKANETHLRGQVVLGVVQGDVHDIGKNLVKIMLESSGFQVYDLGRDVPVERFVEEQVRTNAEIVALSAMMTTTLLGMRDVIKAVKEKNPAVKILIGGAPVTMDIAKKFGADGYGKDANEAVKEAIRLLS